MKVVFHRAINGHLFLTSVCLPFFDPIADNDFVKVFTQHRERAFHGS